MGRELKRVSLDFDWPINKVWRGYLNPHYTAKQCEGCSGTGYSSFAKNLHDKWWGYVDFSPEERDSIPFTPDDKEVRDFAIRNVEREPEFYGTGEDAILKEALRLCGIWNSSWQHHLNDDDVKALIEADRLRDFTHIFTPGKGWEKKATAYIPTAREVNLWGISSMGHDSINEWAIFKAECKRHNEPTDCDICKGHGEIWPSKEDEDLYEGWEKEEPPEGNGFQIWETVSEGSPISPVFSTAEDLAKHMATTSWGADKGTPFETWLQFIKGPGWSPSMICIGGEVKNGVEAIVEL